MAWHSLPQSVHSNQTEQRVSEEEEGQPSAAFLEKDTLGGEGKCRKGTGSVISCCLLEQLALPGKHFTGNNTPALVRLFSSC